MKKTLVALLLAVAMLLSVVPAMAEVSPILPWTGDPIEYDCFGCDLITEAPETQVYQEYLKMIGDVTLNWELVPMGDLDTKLSVYFNSGEISDLMWTRGNTSVINTYGDMEYWLDLSPYLEEYMPNYKWWFENKPHMQSLIQENGEIWCVVGVDNYDYVAETWWYNKTALEGLGYTEAPKTLDEMVEMMKAFKAQNPDQTPFYTNPWGLGTYIGTFSYLSDWQSSTWYWDEANETWANAIVNSESGYKEIIEVMNLMYTEGLIHSEFDALSADQVNQAIADGAWLFGFFYCDSIETKTGANPGFEYDTFTTPALKEGDQRYGMITVSSNGLPGWAYFAAADIEHPEVMASLMDWTISDEATDLAGFGIKGVSYDVDENGNNYYLEDYASNKEKQEALGLNKWFCHLIRMNSNSQWMSEFAKNPCEESKKGYALLTDELRTGVLQHKLPSRGTPVFTTEEGDTVSMSTTPMSTYADENIIRFITGDRPMDEWDAFIEEYKSMGNLEEVISVYNNAEQVIKDTSTNIPDYNYEY